jgi:hypothetical protein
MGRTRRPAAGWAVYVRPLGKILSRPRIPKHPNKARVKSSSRTSRLSWWHIVPVQFERVAQLDCLNSRPAADLSQANLT